MSGKMVSIIILNWNGMRFTKPCVRSIKQNTAYKPYEVIVVDNGSNGKDAIELQQLQKKGLIQKLILNKRNNGFAGGNNQGMRAAKGSYFLLLNNDTLVKKGWLLGLLNAANSDESIGIVQPDLPPGEGKAMPHSGGYIDDSGTARFLLKEKGKGLQQL